MIEKGEIYIAGGLLTCEGLETVYSKKSYEHVDDLEELLYFARRELLMSVDDGVAFIVVDDEITQIGEYDVDAVELIEEINFLTEKENE